MGIKTTEIYVMTCDCCLSEFNDVCYHTEEDTLEYSAECSEWKQIDGKWYCPDCYDRLDDDL